MRRGRKRQVTLETLEAATSEVVASVLSDMDCMRERQGKPPLIYRHWFGKKGTASVPYTVEITGVGRTKLSQEYNQ